MHTARETPVTPAGLEKLREELAQLQQQRPVITARIASARELGDLKENAEYHAAREEQGLLETKIAQLEDRIRTARVVEDVDASVAGIGTAVTTVEEGSGEQDEYTITGPTEADPLEMKVSNESPIGSALMGRSVGDVVTVELPRGSMQLRITAIRPA